MTRSYQYELVVPSAFISVNHLQKELNSLGMTGYRVTGMVELKDDDNDTFQALVLMREFET